MKIVIFIQLFFISAASFGIHIVYNKKTFSSRLTRAELAFVNTVLNQYEWPMSADLIVDTNGESKKNVDIKKYTELLKPGAANETKYVSDLITKKYPHLGVVWIPNTLFDLLMLARHFTFGSPKSSSDITKDVTRQLITAQLFSRLKSLGFLKDKKVPALENGSLLKSLIISILSEFEKDPKDDYSDIAALDLASEKDLVAKNNSAILAATRAEILAHRNNEELLFRATNGLKVRDASKTKSTSKVLDFVLPAPSKKVTGATNDTNVDDILLKAGIPKDTLAGMTDDNKQQLTGLFMAKSESFIPEKNPSVEKSIKMLPAMLKSKTFESLDLSFSYSLFSGCAADIGICTYDYAKSAKFLYALSLSKRYLLTRARQLFYLPEFSATALVFKEGILGHPRARRVGFLRRSDELLGGSLFRFGFFNPLMKFSYLTKDSANRFLAFILELQNLITTRSQVLTVEQQMVFGSDSPIAIELEFHRYSSFKLLEEAAKAQNK